MTRRSIFFIILAVFFLAGCKSADKTENYVYQRDPDVAGTVDALLEKDAPFAALQEILYIDDSRDKIYDKAREEGIVESCRQIIYERIAADYSKAINDKNFDKMVDVAIGQKTDVSELEKQKLLLQKELERLNRLVTQLENQLNALDYSSKAAELKEKSLSKRLDKAFEDMEDIQLATLNYVLIVLFI